MYSFASTTDVIFMNIWHLFSERRSQFASPNGFYSVRHHIYIPSSDYSLQAPTVYIRLITASIYQVVFTVCRFQLFLFCLSPYLFSEWHKVPQLYIQIKQSRVHSRKALYEWKASRRLGKQMRCFYRFLSKAHPAAPNHIQGSYNSLSSVFRLLLIEAITFPFHRQKSKYSLSISLSPRSIFCNNRLLRNFLLSPSTLYGPTL